MARKPAFRLTASAGGGRSRARRAPVTQPAAPQAAALDGCVLEAPFVPALFVPEQWVAGVRRDGTLSGEKALLLAVLKDGIRCFQEHGRGPRLDPRALAAEAEAWIRAVGDDRPCSFKSICEALGFDPGRLRARLLAKASRPHRTEKRAQPPQSAPTLHRLHVRTTPAPSPLTAAGSAARRCVGWSPKATSRRAEPSTAMSRQAG